MRIGWARLLSRLSDLVEIVLIDDACMTCKALDQSCLR
jgi:hypothetical protein